MPWVAAELGVAGRQAQQPLPHQAERKKRKHYRDVGNGAKWEPLQPQRTPGSSHA